VATSKRNRGRAAGVLRDISAADHEMLGAAKLLVDQTPNVDEVKKSEIVVVVDPTHRLGARLIGLAATIDLPAGEAQTLTETLSRQCSMAGKSRLVALWMPRDMLAGVLGAKVLEWDPAQLAPRLVTTLIVGETNSVLYAIDYGRVRRHAVEREAANGARRGAH
jgi:hypothetical protein